jgi:hypothetical protein
VLRVREPEPVTPTISRQGQLLNLEHVRLGPDRVIPWVVDKLAHDTPSAVRSAFGAALKDLSQALRAVHQTKLADLRSRIRD